MTAYEGKYAFLLVRWWADLQNTEDFTNAVHSSVQNLDDFICYFRHTAALIFEVDDRGIWFAASTTRFFDGALFDMWIRPDKRHTSSAWKATQLAYSMALEQYPSLFGMTKQRNLHGIHLKLGYEYGGHLVHNMDGETQFIYQLTREGWAKRKEKAAEVRAIKRDARARTRPAAEPHYTNGAT